MTGNTVLLALEIGQGAFSSALLYLYALGGFSLGILCGTLLVGRAHIDDVRTRAIARALAIEGVLLLIFAVLWLISGRRLSNTVVATLIGLASMAMGLQSTIIRGLGLVGIATTALTLPLATLMSELAKFVDFRSGGASRTKGGTGSPADARMIVRLVAVFLIYGLAALVGAIALIHVQAEAALIPLIALLPVIIYAFTYERTRRHFSTTGDTKSN
jgi:uncharacterized membrane protein YoaK (UPF0700 family)